MPKFIVKVEERFVIYKQYTDGERYYAHPMDKFESLREAVEYLGEEFASAVPANCMGGGAIAGDNIGYSKKRGYKFFTNIMRRGNKKKKK